MGRGSWYVVSGASEQALRPGVAPVSDERKTRAELIRELAALRTERARLLAAPAAPPPAPDEDADRYRVLIENVRAVVIESRGGFISYVSPSAREVLGYEPEEAQVRALAPGPQPNTWKLHGQVEDAPLCKRCGNFETPAGCNWLVDAKEEEPLCRSCRLNRTIPQLNDADNAR